jgi:toxin ParE1/3/4
MKIILSPTAHRDIKSVYDYIVKQNTKPVAKKVLASVENMIDHLAEYSQLGKVGRIKNTRELTVPQLPFIIIYQIHADYIAIISIIHTSRKWQ